MMRFDSFTRKLSNPLRPASLMGRCAMTAEWIRMSRACDVCEGARSFCVSVSSFVRREFYRARMMPSRDVWSEKPAYDEWFEAFPFIRCVKRARAIEFAPPHASLRRRSMAGWSERRCPAL